MYESINDVPVNLQYFYYEEVVDGVTYVREKPRPETKTIADLERVMLKNKPPEVIELFAEMVAEGDKWDWFELYKEYESEIVRIQEINTIIIENGLEPLPYPAEPIPLPLHTSVEALEPYLPELQARSEEEQVAALTVEYEGNSYTADEDAQNRMTRVLSAVDLFPVKWRTADGSTADLDKSDVKSILKLSVNAQSEILVK